jgi:starch phosphorylase
MFSGYKIDSITNGVHVATWTCSALAALYDHHIPGWRGDPAALRYVLGVPRAEVCEAHAAAKRDLLDFLGGTTGVQLDEGAFTLGFARRATSYKRADLLLSDPERLRSIARGVGPMQIVYAGKAHPRDTPGKEIIKRIFALAQSLRDEVRIVFVPNYDVAIAARLVAGVDLWLNTPEPSLEASGTSGMKAAVNGVPSLSVLDGWWIEGHIEGLTGWSLGDPPSAVRDESSRARDAESLYRKLGDVIVPTFYRERERFADVMAHAIAINGSFFNTHRMIQQYVVKAYFEEADWRSGDPRAA